MRLHRLNLVEAKSKVRINCWPLKIIFKIKEMNEVKSVCKTQDLCWMA